MIELWNLELEEAAVRSRREQHRHLFFAFIDLLYRRAYLRVDISATDRPFSFIRNTGGTCISCLVH